MAKTTETENTPQGEEGGSSSSSSFGGRRAGPMAQTSASSASAGSGTSGGTTEQPTRDRHTIAARKSQYLIAARRTPGMQMMGMHPLSSSLIEQSLRAMSDIEVIDVVGPKTIMGALADGFSEAPSVVVARMTEQKAVALYQQGQGRLLVERDQSLALLEPSFQPLLVAGVAPTAGPALSAKILVTGKDNAPVKDAEVYLFGSFLPATGVTDERGQVTLTLYGETVQTVRSLYIKPKSDYWSFYQQQPDLSTDEVNAVDLRPLSEAPSLADFPAQQAYTWGQKAMRLDRLPGDYRGQGVKVAVVDSGAGTTHEDLNRIRFGFDIINKKSNPDTWNEDTVAHGSHCAGIIAGVADNDKGIRGFAPDAEVHACKLFPGGQVSQLIDALEYCIEKQIDVVNLSLGGVDPSEALEQQLLRAKRAGVACIVAAGNSGGPVQYPASSPNVLAVAAIGKLNEFPADSYHTQTVTQFVDGNGFYSAKFSCFGPEIAVCAPGVAITSSVPPNNYAVWDGTSMAAPHITGLAALILAHHPDFRTVFRERNADRVERLFQIIRMSARRINLGDPSRTGFGLPDVLVAVGLQPQVGVAATAVAATTPQFVAQAFGQGFNPYAAAYADPQALSSQVFGGGQWKGIGGIDPAYTAYMSSLYAQQARFPFMGFGRQGW